MAGPLEMQLKSVPDPGKGNLTADQHVFNGQNEAGPFNHSQHHHDSTKPGWLRLAGRVKAVPGKRDLGNIPTRTARFLLRCL
jgi:hypothetical protein